MSIKVHPRKTNLTKIDSFILLIFFYFNRCNSKMCPVSSFLFSDYFLIKELDEITKFKMYWYWKMYWILRKRDFGYENMWTFYGSLGLSVRGDRSTSGTGLEACSIVSWAFSRRFWSAFIAILLLILPFLNKLNIRWSRI